VDPSSKMKEMAKSLCEVGDVGDVGVRYFDQTSVWGWGSPECVTTGASRVIGSMEASRGAAVSDEDSIYAEFTFYEVPIGKGHPQ